MGNGHGTQCGASAAGAAAAAMILLVVFGVMNLAAMVITALGLAGERLWFPGAPL
jgi:hypothetical protein